MAIKSKPHKSPNLNWHNMGNLIFYNGLEPFNFYFDLLLENYEKRPPEYNSFANAIGEAAKSKFNSTINSLKNNKDDEGMTKLESIPAYLEKAIQKESNNELAFFKQKYEWFKSNFSEEELNNLPELKFLFDFFSNPTTQSGTIDYPRFLAAINILIQGYDNAKEIVKYERKRLEDLEKRFAEARKAAGRRAVGLAKKKYGYDDIEKQEQWRETAKMKNRRKVEIHYLKNKNFNDEKKIKGLGLKTRLEGLAKTADVEVADWITKTLQNMLEQPAIRNKIETLIIKNKNLVFTNPQQLAQKVKSSLVQNITSYGVKNIGKILSNQITTKNLDEIISEVEKDFTYDYEIEGFYENFGQYGIELDFFRNPNNLNKDGTKSAERLYEALKRLQHLLSLSRQKNSRIKLTDEQKFVASVFFKDEGIINIMSMISTIEKQMKEVEKAIEEVKKTGQARDKTLRLTYKEYIPNQLRGEKNDGKIKLHIDANGNIDLTSLNRIYGKYTKELGFGSDRIRANTLQGLVSGLKSRLSQKMRNQLEDLISGNTKIKRNKKFSTQSQINQALQEGLEGITVFISAPDLSEIAQGLQFHMDGDNVSLIWTGPHKTKNDFVTITINTPIAEIKTEVSSILNTDIENLGEDIEQLIQNSRKETAKLLGEGLAHYSTSLSDKKQYNKQNEIMKEYENSQKEYFELSEKNNELLENMPNLKELLERVERTNKGQSPEQISAKKKQLLTMLTDFFYESSTMKTFNHYVNDVGFVGGGIGGDVIAQMNKIEEMFLNAGIQLGTDKDWLIGAIINCSSHSVIGTEYQSTIEQYLGAIAVFAMFDEGAVEQSIINNTANIKGNTKFLHLYRLNGGYYLGSYVLTRVLEQFNEYISKIEEVSTKYSNIHGGIAILGGGMTPQDIPNRGLYSSEPQNRSPWQTVSATAKGRASIQVVFLAGLLQTLNQIEAALNNIEYPA